MAHGSEMVLNPSQQGKLWNLIQSSSSTGKAVQSVNPVTNIVYNPVIHSNDDNIGDALAKDKQAFADFAVNAVQKAIAYNENGMRDQIRSL
jgi:hypothetical protein